MHPYLFRALHTVRTADRTPYRQARFRKEIAGRAMLRLAYGLHQLSHPGLFSAFMVASYGMLYAFQPRLSRKSSKSRLLAYTDIANEKRQVAYLRSCLPEEAISELSPASRLAVFPTLLSALPWANAGFLRRYFSLVRRINRQYDGFVACRLAAAIAGYARFRHDISVLSPAAIISANDCANLHVAFTAAAQSLHIPAVFIAHAHVQYYSPRLRFALSILDGQEALDLYRKKGVPEGDILFKGVEGPCALLAFDRIAGSGMRIGIFPKSRIVWPALLTTIDELQAKFQPSSVIIRWHPAMRENPRAIRAAKKRYTNLTITDPALSLSDVLATCDLCVAGNSSVHLQALHGGIPCVHVEGFDISPHDFFGFVATGIVPLFASVSAIDLRALRKFYSEKWRERFTRYDASYLSEQSQFDARIGAAITDLLTGTQTMRYATAAA